MPLTAEPPAQACAGGDSGLQGGVLCVTLSPKAARVAVPIAIDLADSSAMGCCVLAGHSPAHSWANGVLATWGAPFLDLAELSRAEIAELAGGRVAQIEHVWVRRRSEVLEAAVTKARRKAMTCALVAYSGRFDRRLADRIVARLESHCASVMPLAAAELSL